MLSLMSEQYMPFIHSGIIVIENGKPFVYEGYANIRPFLSGPPTDAMHGRIRRVTLEHYIRRQRVTAIFEPPAYVDKTRVAAFAQSRHRDGTPFDPYFDWRDHSKLYCTEFATLALQAGGAPPVTPVRIRDNHSLHIALNWLKISAPEIVTTNGLIQDARRIALISRWLDPKQLESYFSAKKELHERFTADQKLGNVLSWSWRGLSLQPDVAAFLKASRNEPSARVSSLAVEMLGSREQKTVTANR
jgi:hypothetical protein